MYGVFEEQPMSQQAIAVLRHPAGKRYVPLAERPLSEQYMLLRDDHGTKVALRAGAKATGDLVAEARYQASVEAIRYRLWAVLMELRAAR